jgi:hypothetical protein
MDSEASALGCRVKSGYAISILVAGSVDAPRAIDRRRIELSDPSVPESVQPYHAGFGTQQTDEAEIKRLTRIVSRCADRSVRGLVDACRVAGLSPQRINLVVGSTTDPLSIRNQHVRAHAQEGQLFRSVMEVATARYTLRCSVLLERDVYEIAARALGHGTQELRRLLTDLGRPLGPPWRTEEKAAALAAWLALADRPP